MTDKKNIIELKNISKQYDLFNNQFSKLIFYFKKFFFANIKSSKTHIALKDINLSIGKNEAIGIIGKNGSGKSTLLQVISGIINPTEGQLLSNGKIAALLELGSGFNSELTGVENIYLYASLYGLKNHETKALLNQIIDFADIGEYIHYPIKMYSSGMIVRLAFSTIAHLNPDILIIDEALAVGDAIFVQKCMRFIEEFKKNKTLIFVSHDLIAISNISTKVLWIDQGRIKFYGKPSKGINLYNKFILETKNIKNYSQDFKINDNFNFCSDTIKLIDFSISNKNGSKIIAPNEDVNLNFKFKSMVEIPNFIIGFNVKNVYGQKIIEDTSVNLNKKICIKKSCSFSFSYLFKMPNLKSGKYFIDFAISQGNIIQHDNLEWFYDLLTFEILNKKNTDSIITLDKLTLTMDVIND